MNRSIVVFCAALAGIVVASNAAAQAYPNRAVRIVVPFPPSGATDIVARVVADRLGQRLGQSVIVENKPGAGGAIGSEFIARSAADGFSLLLSTSSTHSIGPVLNPKTPYNVERDFAPVSHIGSSTNVLLVGAGVAANSVKELIGLANAQRGRINYGSSGVGTVVHLMGEMFARMAAGVAPEIAQQLSREMAAVIKHPEVLERFANLGLEPVGGTPEQLGAIVRAEPLSVITPGLDLPQRG